MTVSKNYIVGAVLVVSLASNFFLAGHYVGHCTPPPFMAHHGAPREPGPRGAAAMLEGALGPEDAKIFHDIIERDLPAAGDDNQAASFKAMEAALKAPSFDGKAFQEAMQHIHDQHTAMDTAFVKAFSEAAAKISPEGRAKLAEVLAKSPHDAPPPEGGPPGGERPHDDDHFGPPEGPPPPPQ